MRREEKRGEKMRQKRTDAKSMLNMGKPKWNKPTQVIHVLLTLTEAGKLDIIIHSTFDFLVKYTVSKNAKGRTTHVLDAFWYLYQTKPRREYAYSWFTVKGTHRGTHLSAFWVRTLEGEL